MTTPAPEAETTSEFCYRHPNRQSFIHCQRCGRTICPECQTQAAVGVHCPECVREARAELTASRGGMLGQFIPRGTAPLVTYAIMGLCALFYVGQLVSGDALTNAWVLRPDLIVGEPWRLITSAFLHGSPLHILFNLYALYIFGPVLERFLGRARFVALYAIGALGGSVGVVLVWQLYLVTGGASSRWLDGFFAPASALGASGAVFALMGALLVLRKAIGLQLMQIALVVVVNLAFGFFVRGIAWQAHLGGLAVGAAIAAVYLLTRREQQRPAQVAGVAGVAAILAIILGACVLSQPGGYS